MELDKFSQLGQDPPLNGAYIRSLVKQLTTTNHSKSNDTAGFVVVDNSSVSQTRNYSRKHSKVLGSQLSHHQQQHKKQIRRRPHTIRPYQERLLNMAEARREIVTALKFHRANMKQATENQQQQQQQQQIQEQNQQKQDEHNTSFFEQDGKFDSRGNSRILPPSSSCMNNFPSDNNMIDDFSFSFSPIPLPSVQNSFQNFPVFAYSSYSSPIDPPLLAENPDFTSLPNHSLGLDLNFNFNFHNFDNHDATLFLNNNNINSPLFCYSSPTSSSTYSPSLSVVIDQEVPSIIGTTTPLHGEGVSCSSMVDNNNNNTIECMATTHGAGGGLHMHTAIDDESIKEMESLCEQYQMEWNDTMNLITSTWWYNFLNNIENGEPEVKTQITQSDAHQMFDEVIEFPSWLNNNANESFLEQCAEDNFKGPTLICMDIEDIEFEGMDGEWLS